MRVYEPPPVVHLNGDALDVVGLQVVHRLQQVEAVDAARQQGAAGAHAVEAGVVDAGRHGALVTQVTFAALSSRRRARMIMASDVPRCSWVRS